ncbi:MAG: DUF433 domain-containing protein [Ignavibacteria bacterium]|nr:DUF433 domain-containing protein [Ignavibacteria bacterium]MBK7252367.1 DUF433 domain-containing protein [Ignavibacteria bacterium]MBK7445283.1 DUF433 domain-containing protein [Ignavibacteria bacterium]MBK8383149.1 DUF433 domain-containing protein [Ignavibacteria bacterium]MBK9402997.1 DUF433 domain-containing protein [Ignavibacteria bacterium]
MEHNLLDRITINPKVMVGKPTIRGTRLTVEIILEKLAGGESENKIMEDYPILEKEDIRACLLYAAKSLSLSEILEV